MYQVGEYVVYNEDGVCRIEGAGPLKIAAVSGDRAYYTMSPLSGDGRIYVPVDTKLPIRPAMGREEALRIIDEMPDVQAEVCRMAAKRPQEEHYRAMMAPHTPLAMVKTLKSVYAKRHDGDKLRTLSSTDEYYRKRAETLLFQELSVALDIPLDAVEGYIMERLGAGE